LPLLSGSSNAGLLLSGHNFLNWHLTLRSFYYSLYASCMLSWRRALGPFGGLSSGQLMLFAPHGKKEERLEIGW